MWKVRSVGWSVRVYSKDAGSDEHWILAVNMDRRWKWAQATWAQVSPEIIRVTSWSACIRPRIKFTQCSGQLTRKRVVEGSQLCLLSQGSQKAVCRALTCQVMSPLQAPHLLSHKGKEGSRLPQSDLYGPTCGWSFCVEGQRWVTYCASHWWE